jgi:putative ATP-dependent endonuclease of OLD family
VANVKHLKFASEPEVLVKLVNARVKDFRSLLGEHELKMVDGVNYLVGPNNCGKSNLISAIALALDPDITYVPERDQPATSTASAGPTRTTRITLTFIAGKSASEFTLLKYAREYEKAVRNSGGSKKSVPKTYADDREVRLVTVFSRTGERSTTFATKGVGARTLGEGTDQHRRLEMQFRKVVRYAGTQSGEDLYDLLHGKFREILHLVIGDHLGIELESAESARNDYDRVLRESVLAPLRDLIQRRTGAVFGEIDMVELLPDIPTVSETLSSVDVQLRDQALTQLTGKGTGVRGAVLVAMLQYLADQSRRSLVLAVEEPETFLHPAAQEIVRGHLEELAKKSTVTLLVTTHSPYVISRLPNAQVTELRKLPSGSTSFSRSARGSDDLVEVLGSLYRDIGLAGAIERSLKIPHDARAVVVTEGYTDGAFINAACKALGRMELIKGLHFIPSGSAKRLVPQAVLAGAATSVPVIALLDHDDSGRAAVVKLNSFDWKKGTREILTLNKWPDACKRSHDVEIEDLIPAGVISVVVGKIGEDRALQAKEKCRDDWHYRLSEEGKDALIKVLPSAIGRFADNGLIWVAEELNRRVDVMSARVAPADLESMT